MRSFYPQKRWQRVFLRIAAGIAGLILSAWLALGLYVQHHKKEILDKLTTKLSERLHGHLSIRDMEPSFWKSFPDISVVLKDVTLRDSLWEQHRHSLLDVKNLFVKVNTFGLLSRRVEIKKITAAHGTAFVYEDSSGYSNVYLLERRDTTKKNHTSLLENFAVEDLHFYYINKQKQKDFHFYISALEGNATQSLGVMHIRLAAAAHVYSMAFNTARGSYLRNQDMVIDGRFSYIIREKRFVIPEQSIAISKENVRINGQFFLDRVPSEFELHFHAPLLPFHTAIAWMAQNVSGKAAPYSFAKPIEIWADIVGTMKYQTVPLVHVRAAIRDNTLRTPLGNIDSITGNMQYFNEAVKGRGRGDDNSEMGFTALSGSWQHLPFACDTLLVRNLLVPFVNAHITSNFPLHALDGLLGAEVFSFEKGRAVLDLHYTGGVGADDTSRYALNGFMRFSDAALTYIPRRLSFGDVKANILFEGDNLFLRDVSLRSRTSSINMEGDALHFFRLYFTDPGKILVAWRARSPQVNLNEFLAFTGTRKKAAPRRAAGSALYRISNQLDRVLDESNITIDAQVDKLLFKNFIATGVIAKARLEQDAISVEKVALQQAGGSLELSGIIHQSQVQNPFSMIAVVRNVDVSAIFQSFDNFGQDAINANNIRGKLSANITLAGGISEAGGIIRKSLKGALGLHLEDGEFDNYTPLQKISRFVFKRRNLDHLTFKTLDAKLGIENGNIIIQPLKIETSAIVLQAAGVYDPGGTGTDIALQIPLRNPSKDKAKTPFGKLLRTGKGFVVHLRAQSGGTSGVKIGWDPLQKGRHELPDSMRLD